MSENHLLLVDDDPKIQRLLRSHLLIQGYTVEVSGNGADALRAIGETPPNLVLLDLCLPEIDGITVCRLLRSRSNVPVILLTANDSIDVKISALDAGADDYLTKPFHMGELTARIRTILRRVSRAYPETNIFILGNLEIDIPQRMVRRGGETIHLTRTEFDLLSEMLRHAGQLLTYEHLLHAIWGQNQLDVHSVHVHVSNLRRKIEKGMAGPKQIVPVTGVGYRLQA